MLSASMSHQCSMAHVQTYALAYVADGQHLSERGPGTRPPHTRFRLRCNYIEQTSGRRHRPCLARMWLSTPAGTMAKLPPTDGWTPDAGEPSGEPTGTDVHGQPRTSTDRDPFSSGRLRTLRTCLASRMSGVRFPSAPPGDALVTPRRCDLSDFSVGISWIAATS